MTTAPVLQHIMISMTTKILLQPMTAARPVVLLNLTLVFRPYAVAEGSITLPMNRIAPLLLSLMTITNG